MVSSVFHLWFGAIVATTLVIVCSQESLQSRFPHFVFVHPFDYLKKEISFHKNGRIY